MKVGYYSTRMRRPRPFACAVQQQGTITCMWFFHEARKAFTYSWLPNNKENPAVIENEAAVFAAMTKLEIISAQ